MGEILLWLVTVEVLGLLALPVAATALGRLPGRGLGFAKPAGLLLVSYLSWLLGMLGLLPYTRAAIVLVVVAMAVLSAWLLHVGAIEIGDLTRTWQKHRTAILVGEGLFLVAFAAAAVVRGFMPEIAATEKPMEFAFLNSLVRGQQLPPADPWLAGYSINYYYFGYVIFAELAKLTGIDTAVVFNLANVTLFALTALGAYSLVWNLIAAASGGRATHGGISFGLLGAAMVALLGNLFGAFKLVTQPDLVLRESWWAGIGWNSSRIILDHLPGRDSQTINEFPFFSFLLADLHPHVMALPFVLLALGVGVQAVLARGERPFDAGVGPARWIMLGFAAVVLGSLFVLNSWDYPTYVLLAVGAGALAARHRVGLANWRSTASALVRLFGPLVVLSFGLYLPFYVTFRSLVGASPPDLPPSLRDIPLLPQVASFLGVVYWGKTDLASFLTIFGLFVYLIGTWLLIRGRVWSLPTRVAPSTWLPDLAPVLLLLAGGALLRFPLLAILPATAYWAFLLASRQDDDPADRFALLLVGGAATLVFLCELFYLQDVFHDRMNTVFKFYYQAWVLLGIAGAYGTWWVWRRARLPLVGRALWGTGLAGLLAASLVYPLAATPKKAGDFSHYQGLTGTAWFAASAPADYRAIQWLRANVKGNPIVLEATGAAYSEFARVSSLTGLPTLLGWANHETQWRGGQKEALDELGVRARDIDTIYGSTDPQATLQLLHRYQVAYVYVGSIERGQRERRDPGPWKYSPEALAKFGTIGKPVYDVDGVTIYQIP